MEKLSQGQDESLVRGPVGVEQDLNPTSIAAELRC